MTCLLKKCLNQSLPLANQSRGYPNKFCGYVLNHGVWYWRAKNDMHIPKSTFPYRSLPLANKSRGYPNKFCWWMTCWNDMLIEKSTCLCRWQKSLGVTPTNSAGEQGGKDWTLLNEFSNLFWTSVPAVSASPQTKSQPCAKQSQRFSLQLDIQRIPVSFP